MYRDCPKGTPLGVPLDLPHNRPTHPVLTRSAVTLIQWAEKYNERIVYVPLPSVGPDAFSTCVYPPKDSMWELSHLTDYALSSLSGPVAWMHRRTTDSQN